jgi:adenosylhomocysteine nucleosidase
MTRVAIIAAMAAELKPLVRGWERESRSGVDLWRWRHADGNWIAGCAGAGVDAASRAFAEIERDGAIDSVISAGWAGALRGDLAAGRAYRASGVIDARTAERFPAAGGPGDCWLVTADRIAGPAEKRRLAAACDAGLVDMEAAGVARLAALRGIPFQSVKGVSDSLADPLPDLNRFLSPTGRFHLARFVAFALLRPWHWPVLARMGENSASSARLMSASLLEILDPRGTLRRREGQPEASA